MIAAIFPSPEVILAAAVIAAIAGLRLMLPFRRERRAALWLGGLLAVAAVILFSVKDRLGVRDDAATGLRVVSNLELFFLTVDRAVRFALAAFTLVTAAVTVLWLLLPSGLKRRTASWLLALLGGATLAYLGRVGTPIIPASGEILATAVAATAASLWHLLPQVIENPADRRFNQWFGLLLGTVALAGFVATGQHLGGLGEEAVFLIVSLVAVVSAAATIVSRSPVYAAIWFALSLAGVAGVLLVLGAQFLGVATIVVYAGAILVMFLFVLMLAQPAGLAPYDRVSNEPFLSALAGAVLLGVLSLSIGRLSAEPASCCKMPSKADAVASATQAAKPAAANDTVTTDNDKAAAPPAAAVATLTPVLALGTGVANGATTTEATQNSGVVTVSGERNASIAVTFSRSANSVTKTVTGTGAAKSVVLLTDDLTTLGNGTVNVSAVATDVAGNTGPAGTTSFVLDTVAPTVSGFTHLPTNGTDGTKDEIPIPLIATLSEPVQAGGSIAVTLNTGAVVILKAATQGNSLTGTYVVSKDKMKDDLDVVSYTIVSALRDTAGNELAADPLAENHVARLGGELFGQHLVAVEAAGVLLLVALIGAIAVVSRGEAAHATEASATRAPSAGRSAIR